MSLIVALFGKRRIVVAADSRMKPFPGRDGHISDDGCKIARFGSSGVFAAVGTGGSLLQTGEYVRIDDRATEVCGSSAVGIGAKELLEQIADKVCRPFITPFLSTVPEGDDPFTSFALLRSMDGTIDIHELHYSGQSTEIRPVPGVPRWRNAFAIGYSQCIDPEALRRVDPDLPDGVVLASLEKLFRAAECDPRSEGYVGGPIDICALDADGVRWLQRKPEREKKAILKPPAWSLRRWRGIIRSLFPAKS